MSENDNNTRVIKEFGLLIGNMKNIINLFEVYIGQNFQELLVLYYIRDNDILNENNIYAIDIQNKFNLSKSNVSNIINNLVKKGFLLRHHDEKNRKKIILVLTEKGKEILNETNKKFTQLTYSINNNLKSSNLLGQDLFFDFVEKNKVIFNTIINHLNDLIENIN